MYPVMRSGAGQSQAVKSNPEKSIKKFICAGFKRTGNKCSHTLEKRHEAIEICEKIKGCSHIGKLDDNGKYKFVILEAAKNGYFIDSNTLIVKSLQSHKNRQSKNRQQRQRLVRLLVF